MSGFFGTASRTFSSGVIFLGTSGALKIFTCLIFKIVKIKYKISRAKGRELASGVCKR